jgi:hypothetical protein
MKKKLLSSLVLIAIILNGCSAEDVPLLNEAKVVERMTSGNWKITKMTYKSVDKTSSYSSVTFDFDAINVSLTGTGTTPVVGGWGVIDEGFEGDPVLVFNLALTSVEERFTNISDDWYIIESTSSKLRMKDENPETGDIDFLTFEKIN